jgi:hypothetical protein
MRVQFIIFFAILATIYFNEHTQTAVVAIENFNR